MYLNECYSLELVVNIINDTDCYNGDLESHGIAGLYAAEAAQESGDLTEYNHEIQLEAHLGSLRKAGAQYNWADAWAFGLSEITHSKLERGRKDGFRITTIKKDTTHDGIYD